MPHSPGTLSARPQSMLEELEACFVAAQGAALWGPRVLSGAAHREELVGGTG